MKKLLELKKLDTEVRDLLGGIELPVGINICTHLHYDTPKISIYPLYELGDIRKVSEIYENNVLFIVDDTIGVEIARDIIEKVNEVLK